MKFTLYSPLLKKKKEFRDILWSLAQSISFGFKMHMFSFTSSSCLMVFYCTEGSKPMLITLLSSGPLPAWFAWFVSMVCGYWSWTCVVSGWSKSRKLNPNGAVALQPLHQSRLVCRVPSPPCSPFFIFFEVICARWEAGDASFLPTFLSA